MDRGGSHGSTKKLLAVALYFARGGGEFDQARADLRAFGATEEAIAEQLGPEEKDCLVEPENWEAVKAFLSVGTQWARGGMGDITALDYTRARDGLEMAGIAVTPDLWQKVRMIESGVLFALAKKEKATERA